MLWMIPIRILGSFVRGRVISRRWVAALYFWIAFCNIENKKKD
jgi:hypothetical protein